MDRVAWLGSVRSFFKIAFSRSHQGYLCIASLPIQDRRLKERYFKWPDQFEPMLAYLADNYEGFNTYFCPQMLADPDYRRPGGKSARVKENILECPVIWSDLDECPPSQLLIEPSIILETSYKRYQALWTMEQPIAPADAEDIAKRIHYLHADEGADKSGWDLTQLLRVPGTINYKRDNPFYVETRQIATSVFRVEDFTQKYRIIERDPADLIPMPTELTESGKTAEELLKAKKVGRDIHKLFSIPPAEGEYEEGWSGALWKLILNLFEAGFKREEVFTVCKEAACNKYARDGRPDEDLWNDIARGYLKSQRDAKTPVVPELVRAELLSEDEKAIVAERETFVERYTKWASGLGDAAVQYHPAGAFVILSALLAGKVVLPTSFGNIVPNLWFMILANTTLTRKSSAMDIATDLLLEVDADAIMATDGSIEGLLSSLSLRPGRPSIFLRDEFSGLLEAMTKKDYMAGMPETLTKLYDGKYSKRVLRKESIEIKDPILVVFAGGIRDRIQQLLTLDHVSSGFMPRFVFITAESDVSKVRPLGPPVVRDLTGREELLDEMREMYIHYNQARNVPTKGVYIGPSSKLQASLTETAWHRFNEFETLLLKVGTESERADVLTPVFDRLGKSALKCAVLLAASEQREENVIVDTQHILHAIKFTESWYWYAIEVINGVGKSNLERDIERILDLVRKRPGVSRSAIMQNFHLTAQSASQLFNTMEQRGLVRAVAFGKGTNFWTAEDYRKREQAEEEEANET